MDFDIDSLLQDDRHALINHPLFPSIDTIEDVRVLMETHIYAVWDFMSLLKRIQRDLTCVEVPWTPPRHHVACRLVNEIVVGEESDEMPGGTFVSHLELYLAAMDEIGADTSGFRLFLKAVEQKQPIGLALEAAEAPEAARRFVMETIDVAQRGSTAAVLAYFFFGREDIIPDMFGRLLHAWSVPEASVPMFSYYLKRHIEMDGDDHGPAAKRLVGELVGASEQAHLVERARAAIRARIRLWDGVHHAVLTSRSERTANALNPA